MGNNFIKIKPEDLQGNYDFKLNAGETEPIGNLCSYCGKCAKCEHPYWTCPKLASLAPSK